MNKYLPGFILFIALLTTTPAFAVETVTPTTTTRETIKNARETYKQEMLTARENFKAKLQSIKDVKKQATVERIDARLAEVNTKRTDTMSRALTHLSTLLERIASKTATITPAPTLNPSLLTTARAAIITAQQAVDQQAAKEYVITLGTDATLRSAVLTTITALHNDLKTTHETVKTARTAVIAALTAMASAIKEPTITPEGGVIN